MNKLKVCLTGGIASGKTFVSDHFATLGACIIDTDILARHVVEPGSAGLSQLVDAFGDQILLSDGELNRRHLKQLIFSDDDKRKTVNGILHPLIWEAAEQASIMNHLPMELWVIPLYSEHSTRITFDRVLVIDVDESIQLSRIQNRDQLDEVAAQAIIDSQLSREERLLLATDVIANNQGLQELALNATRMFHFYQAMIDA